MEKITRTITLKDGSVIILENDAMNCPCCLNGSMTVNFIDNDNNVIHYYCDKCQSELALPFIKCDSVSESFSNVDEGDFGPNNDKTI